VGSFGFDFHPSSEELSPSEKEIFDVSAYKGICVRYKSNNSGWFLMNATYDQYSFFVDYGKAGYRFAPSDDFVTACEDWSSLTYRAWGVTPFAADQVTGMHYNHETELDTVYAEITIQKVYLY
jgi:hypothetical protein